MPFVIGFVTTVAAEVMAGLLIRGLRSRTPVSPREGRPPSANRLTDALRSTPITKTLLITLPLAAVVGVLAGLIVVWLSDDDGVKRQPKGRITAPDSGSRVSAGFTVEGTLSSIPDDHHVWLVVQVGNDLFPKTPEIPSRDQDWDRDIVEAPNAPEGEFSLVLLLVDDAGQNTIKEWLGEGERTGEYPALSKIPGSSGLDVVRHLSTPGTTTTTTTTTTTATATTDSTALPPALPRELEDATGSGEIKSRSNASAEGTRWLHNGEAARLPFGVLATGSYQLVVRYSNDNNGPAETITIAVDGATIGEFQPQDTGDGGSGWNVFSDSPPLGPVELASGSHELTVSVSGGDGYGVEFDLVSAA